MKRRHVCVSLLVAFFVQSLTAVPLILNALQSSNDSAVEGPCVGGGCPLPEQETTKSEVHVPQDPLKKLHVDLMHGGNETAALEDDHAHPQQESVNKSEQAPPGPCSGAECDNVVNVDGSEDTGSSPAPFTGDAMDFDQLEGRIMHGDKDGHVHDKRDPTMEKPADLDDFKRWLEEQANSPEGAGLLARFKKLKIEIGQFKSVLKDSEPGATASSSTNDSDPETLQEKVDKAILDLEKQEAVKRMRQKYEL